MGLLVVVGGLIVGSVAEAQETPAVAEEIAALVPRVGGGDYVARQRLIQIGLPAVPALFEWVAGEEGRPALEARSALRWIAQGATGSRAQQAVLRKALVERTRTDQPVAVRCFAAELLGLCGGEEAVPVLAGLLGEEAVREAASSALQLIPGPAATQALVKALPLVPPVARPALLQALGERRDPAAVPALTAAAGDENEAVQIAALQALGQLGDAAVLPTLVQAYQQGSERVKTAAVAAGIRVGEACLARGEKREALEIYQVALEAATNDAERNAALLGLGRTGEADAVPTITEVLNAGAAGTWTAAFNAYLGIADAHLARGERPHALALYQNAAVLARTDAQRSTALLGLGRTECIEAIPALRTFIVQGSPEVQVTAVAALHRIPRAEATQALAETLPEVSGTPWVARVALLRALGERRDPATVPAILAVAHDENEEVQVAAMKTLGCLPDPAAAPTLLTALETGSEAVKAAAAEAYLRVGDLDLEKGLTADALAVYHRVLDAAPNDATRVAALAGLARIGSPESLSRVEPLLAAEGALRDEAINAAIAIADRLVAAGRREEAIRTYTQVQAVVPADKRAVHVGGRLRALGVKQEFASQGGVVSYWWLLGPFPAPNEDSWRTEHPPEKEAVDLTKEYEAAGRRLSWWPYHTPHELGRVNLDALFEPNERVLCYAYAEVTVEQEQDVFLKMGSDDGIVCWLNGEKIHEVLAPRSLEVDQDNVPAHLKAGPNHLLLKVIEIGGGWEHCLRITDRNDQPVAFKMR